jgi:hypothetical protein
MGIATEFGLNPKVLLTHLVTVMVNVARASSGPPEVRHLVLVPIMRPRG